CPIAYQLTAVQALEQAFGLPELDPQINNLRRLLYYAEWIESHALHIHLLHAADFFGCESGIELAQRFPAEVNRGLRLKKIGNRMLEVIGGRAIHPINVAVGGLFGVPRREDLEKLIPELEWAVQAAIETVHWVADFVFDEFEMPYEYVSLTAPDHYAIIKGTIQCSDGMTLSVEEFETQFAEHQVPHSTALHSLRMPEQRPYFVGPLARMNQNFHHLGEVAQSTATAAGWLAPCYNPYRSIVARAVEVVEACSRSLELLRQYTPPKRAREAFTPRAGDGCAATEAPRGLIYHRYQTDADGKIERAKIVPPTSQNQAQIEADLWQLLPEILSDDDQAISLKCEKLIRSYDPCISCATHFLQLKIDR
ncbi:MAG: nickel-dependent hydrogenase large subunit, partial [Pirellulaceae bacterium]|nr:nickel-dependent hydrogenase large subunit [Pirellulaceae bacterium]